MPFKMKYKSNSEFPFKEEEKTAIEAIEEVDASSTGYPKQDKSKMETEKAIYLAKLRGDYIDLTGDKLKKASYDDPTGTVVSKGPEGPITGN